MKVPERSQRGRERRGGIFEETIAENLPKLMKSRTSQTPGAQQISNKVNKREFTASHSVEKLSNTKERDLKSSNTKTYKGGIIRQHTSPKLL